MAEPVSPYELLRMSKPRPASTVVTAYDLYSAAQSQPARADAQMPREPPRPAAEPPRAAAEPPRQEPAPSAFMPPVRRTHYIADIKSRHEQALRGLRPR